MDTQTLTMTELRSRLDRNGNSRSLTVLTNGNGTVVNIFADTHRQTVREAYPDVQEGLILTVTPSQFKSYKDLRAAMQSSGRI